MYLMLVLGHSDGKNQAIIDELHGHIAYQTRQPLSGEVRLLPCLLDMDKGEEVVAEGYEEVYDKARACHRYHTASKLGIHVTPEPQLCLMAK